MKQIFIALLFIANINIYSQDKEPSAYKFEWGSFTNDTTLILDSFNVNRFKLGFQWSGSSQMSNALYHNIVHGGSFDADDIDSNYSEEMYIIGQVGTQIKDMSMIQYEPTLQTDDYKNFDTRANDPSNAVFGFNNIHGTILDSSMSGNVNYNRLILYQDSMSSYPANKIVLSDITPKNQFFTFNDDGGQMEHYDGTGWNVSINVRRLDLADSILSDDPVLVIKLPYMARDTNGTQYNRYINFDAAPDMNKNVLLLNYLEDRGIAVDTSPYEDTNINPLDSIVITKRMLSKTNYPRDWTISAHFTCYPNYDGFENHLFYNPYFRPGIGDTIEKEFELVEEIDIEVKYYGNCDIAIDWIRIENDKAQQVLRGQYDASARADVSTFVNNVLSEEKNGSKVYKIHRLYNQDTESSNPTWWGQARYWNLVTNGVTITRDGLSAPEAYKYYTKAPNRWIGFGYGNDDVLMPTPYSRNGSQDSTTMELKHGFAEEYFPDSLSSQYEMNLNGSFVWDDFDIDSNYFNQISSDVLQSRYEEKMYYSIFNPTLNGFLYDNEEWYFYNLLFNVVSRPQNTYDDLITFSFHRVKTFEEYNLMNYTALLHGCTGFINDGDQNRKFPDFGAGNMGVGDYTKLDSNNDIYSNLVGDDFINAEWNTWNAMSVIDTTLFKENMGVEADRVYIGTKSTRDALYQFNTFIRATEGELLKLSLAASMSKGYRTLYTQNEDIYGTDTLLNKFLNFDTTKSYTKRMYKKKIFDTTYTESYDSAFFNITILKEDDVPLDSVFYIGVQNRRTDPLIYWQNPLNPSEKYMRFLSSAEFRDSCINSNDSLIYQDYWWKRLGAREVTLPFDYIHTDNNDYYLLKVSELGHDVDSLNALWHRGEKYYDMIDTVVGQDRPLGIRLLPGQAKILKVEVLKSDFVEGYLDNYNQTKLISFPSTSDSTKVTYHLTYVKNELKPNDPTKEYKTVRYIKSKDIARNSQEENIEWDLTSQLEISRHFLETEDPMNPPPNYSDCNHPAIVVRDDSLGNTFAYIVYTCKDTLSVALDSARVVEAKINVSSNAIVSNTQIYKLNDNDIETQGTPVINASANGNFIAWTVKNEGLFVGFHPPEGTQPIAFNSLANNASLPFCITGSDMLYPSINTYSKISLGENNAALTWYQRCDTNNGNVYYSRLFYNSTTNSVEFKIPIQYEGNLSLLHDPLLRFVTITKSVPDTTIPIIYRSLDDYNIYNPYSCIYNRFDNIHWVVHKQTNYLPPSIHTITLAMKDTNHATYMWTASERRHYQFVGDLNNVKVDGINTAQQHGYIIDGENYYPAGNYNFNVNLSNSKIYQVPGYNQSILQDVVSEIDYTKNGFREAGEGSMSHLAQAPQPNLSETGEIWKNRRVFETDETGALGNPIIKTSAKLFYKQTDYGYESEGYFGFKSGSNDLVFSPPFIGNDPIGVQLTPKIEDIIQPCDLTKFNEADTILTQYLYLEDNGTGDHDVSMGMIGNRDTNIKVFVQRLLDGAMAQLPIPLSTLEDQDKKLFYTIVDSTNDEFRFLYVSSDTNTKYAERAYIGGITHQDSTYYKSNGDKYHYIIDFNNGTNYKANETSKLQLVVYPNPTNGKVQVQSILPEGVKQYKNSHRNITVGVYSTTGKLLYEKIGNTGQIIEFDMSSSPTGSYIINASYEDDINKLKGMKKLIKE